MCRSNRERLYFQYSNIRVRADTIFWEMVPELRAAVSQASEKLWHQLILFWSNWIACRKFSFHLFSCRVFYHNFKPCTFPIRYRCCQYLKKAMIIWLVIITLKEQVFLINYFIFYLAARSRFWDNGLRHSPDVK